MNFVTFKADSIQIKYCIILKNAPQYSYVTLILTETMSNYKRKKLIITIVSLLNGYNTPRKENVTISKQHNTGNIITLILVGEITKHLQLLGCLMYCIKSKTRFAAMLPQHSLAGRDKAFKDMDIAVMFLHFRAQQTHFIKTKCMLIL